MTKYIMLCLAFWAFFESASVSAQAWTLQRCIEQAEQNSLDIKQAQLGVQQETVNWNVSKLSRYPNLSANTGFSYNIGRPVDPTTNSFTTSDILANSYGLNAAATVYNGGLINNTIAQNALTRAASEEDLKQTRANIALSVAQAYLQILLSLERAENADLALQEAQRQETRTSKLIEAGALPEADIYELQAQIARNEQDAITAQNAVEQGYLNLKILLQLPLNEPFSIEVPKLEIPKPETLDVLPLEKMMETAVESQPSVRAGELRLEAANYGIELAKAGMRPSLNVFLNAGTNYSSIARRLSGDYTTVQTAQTVTLAGVGTTELVFDNQVPILENNPYFSQVRSNVNGSVGVSLNVPIYDRGRTKSNIQLAELNIVNQEIANRRTKQAIEADVQRAFTDVKAAAKQLQAAQKTLIASQLAFGNTQKRYDAGATDLLALNTSRNNLTQAGLNLLIAKYDYIFKLKILDFYQGKKITL
jgi:outer membrane protein